MTPEGADRADGQEPAPRRTLRVVISAFSCIPGSGSEPGAGWSWAVAAAARHDVTLLTWEGYRHGVEDALAALPGLPVRPMFIPQPSWLPGGAGDLRALRARYALWQAVAHRAVRRAHARTPFDVAHHLTLAADWMPPGAGGVPGLPLVWGPVGGYSRPAWRMARWLGPRWVAGEAARRAGTGLFRASAGRWAARHASLVVAQNDDSAERLRQLGARRVVVEPNVALEGLGSTAGARPRCIESDGRPGRAVFAGRLLRWKGAALALRALADRRLTSWALDVYGDGPDRLRLEGLSHRLGLDGRVRFHGMCERAQVRASFASANVLVLPSLNDSAGWVIPEAALEGCPTVCLDRGGPLGLVGQGAGIAVAVGPDLPRRLATAMLESRRLEQPLCRWGTDRLPSLVDGWYQAVVAEGPRSMTSA